MKRTSFLTAVIGTALIGVAALFSSVSSAGNAGWSVSIRGPGFAVSAGQPYYGAPYRPYYQSYYRPYYRPVVVAPPVVYGPRPYHYARPVVVAPRPVFYGSYGY
jgi:hypothetical protein